MKVTEHVEHLLRQGRKPKELIELGFPKSVVTRVRRRLKEEKAAPQSKTKEGGTIETQLESGAGSLESNVEEFQSRVEVLETIVAELCDIENRLAGTPTLGLKHLFKCNCGASGLVALHIQCTKCGKETWWGWWPEK
jgi:hypothetical protein